MLKKYRKIIIFLQKTSLNKEADFIRKNKKEEPGPSMSFYTQTVSDEQLPTTTPTVDEETSTSTLIEKKKKKQVKMDLREALRSDKFDQLEKMQWSSRSSPNKGPKRLCIFCLLAILLPIITLCIPLYMRHRALKPHFFTLSPSDMKLLNHVSLPI